MIVLLANSDQTDKLGVATQHSIAVRALLTALITSISASFRSRAALQLEILALRHQIGILQRSVKRTKLTTADRLLWVWLCSVWQDWQCSVFIIKAATVLGWHRNAFRLFWRWKIRRGKVGRPAAPKEVRQLIRTMSRENPIWGAPRICGELLKRGRPATAVEIRRLIERMVGCQSAVAGAQNSRRIENAQHRDL